MLYNSRLKLHNVIIHLFVIDINPKTIIQIYVEHILTSILSYTLTD